MRSGSLRTRRNIGRRNTRGWRRQKGDGMLRKAEEANDSYSVLNLVAYLLPVAIHSVGGTVDVEDSWTQLTSTDIIQTRLSVLQVCSTRKDHLSNLCCFCCCCCHSGFLWWDEKESLLLVPEKKCEAVEVTLMNLSRLITHRMILANGRLNVSSLTRRKLQWTFLLVAVAFPPAGMRENASYLESSTARIS